MAAEFDVLILGAGSGGYACALRAAQLGLSVGLVEKGNLGGTCLHVGCIPTKALLHAAEIADGARDSEQFGVRATLDGIDMPGVNAYKDGVVSRLFKGLTGLIKGRGITVIEGEGRLTGPHEVTVDGTAYAGKHLVLASGSYSPIAARPRHRRPAGDHLRARAPARHRPVVGGGARRRRHRRRVRQRVAVVRRRGDDRRGTPPARRRRGRGVLEGARAHVQEARDRDAHRHAVPVGQGDRRRRRGDGRGRRRDRGRAAARGGRSRAVDRRPGLRRAGRRDGARVRAHRRPLPHQPRRRVRRRRHRPRPPARPPRLPAGHLRGRGDRRPGPGADRRGRHPARHLLPPRGRLRRADRGPGRPSGTARSRR